MAELKDYKCPNCDAALRFDSKSQKLKCDACDGEFDVEDFDSKNEDFNIKADKFKENENLYVYVCDSCGGTIMADENTAATSCPYCGSNVVIADNVKGDYRPSKIIPFVYDKAKAKENFKKHLQKKVLLPKDFQSDTRINEIKGIYVPFWLFDGNAVASCWFNASNSRSFISGDYEITETDHYRLYRSGYMEFEKVPVDASSKLDDDLMQSIEPFNYNEAIDFTSGYLSGFVADKYDVSALDSQKYANERIQNSTISEVASTAHGYQTCTMTSSKCRVKNGDQTYVMYPVWLLNTTYKGKKYTFAMNGQTGKFVGNLPIDKLKLIEIILITFFGTGLLSYLIMFLVVMGR